MQVYFSEEQRRALQYAARREGVSVSAFLRSIVERELLGRFSPLHHPKDAVMALTDLGRSGRSDISEHHDKALAEAFRDDAVFSHRRFP